MRYNSDGTLDTSFGTGGKMTTDFSSNSAREPAPQSTRHRDDEGRAVAVQDDGHDRRGRHESVR